MSNRRLLIIPAAAQAECNSITKQHFDPEGGEHTFTVPLFAEDAPDDTTPTHYVASADIQDKNLSLLDFYSAQVVGSQVYPYDANGDPGFPWRKLQALGLRMAQPKL